MDTHALLWFIEGDQRLPSPLRTILDQVDTQKYVSKISFWELSIKKSLGKLHTRQAPSTMLQQIQMTDALVLGIQSTHLTQLETLPFHHRDPFDRLLIATAMAEGLTLISADQHFHAYEGISLLWE
ncbi:MAG: type II toxin-antitoxin system VapC family toxin [Candidatus Sericytochromatia bacterium]